MADGKTILITGSTDGVGRCVARKLGKTGTRVLVHGRGRDRGESLVAEIVRQGGQARFYPADLSSLADVRHLAQAIQRDESQLDVLINNAGIGTGGRGQRQTSVDGHELRFAVNYLSAFLLTRLLLPLLKARAPGRIVNVSSVGQDAIDFSDVMLTRGYSGGRAYCQSKLAEVMLTFDLAEELKNSGVTATCLHPATYMDTTMVRMDGISPMSSVEDGAAPILHLADSPETEGKTGLYFDRFRASRAHPQAYDAAARARLRTLSFELTGLEPDIAVSG
jgi:NAD(P)-dependent dehydrogenase (short-subunit alcohol dehydrogenase family)